MKAGDRVLLSVGKQTIEADVTLVSENGRSLAVTFDGELALGPNICAVGMLMLLRRDDVWMCIATRTQVKVQVLS